MKTKIKSNELDMILTRRNIERGKLAEDIGISPVFLSQIIGGHQVGPKTREKLMQYLNCDFDDLFLIITG